MIPTITLGGKDSKGRFSTTAAKEYPSPMNLAITQSVNHFLTGNLNTDQVHHPTEHISEDLMQEI